MSVFFVSPAGECRSDQAECSERGLTWDRQPGETQQQFIDRVEADMSEHPGLGVVIFWNPVRPEQMDSRTRSDER